MATRENLSYFLAFALTAGKPRKLIGDKAYDSDPLDETCRTLGIELIAPQESH